MPQALPHDATHVPQQTELHEGHALELHRNPTAPPGKPHRPPGDLPLFELNLDRRFLIHCLRNPIHTFQQFKSSIQFFNATQHSFRRSRSSATILNVRRHSLRLILSERTGGFRGHPHLTIAACISRTCSDPGLAVEIRFELRAVESKMVAATLSTMRSFRSASSAIVVLAAADNR